MTSSLLKNDYKCSQRKSESIDKLLSNGIYFKTPQKVKAETMDRSIEYKAPFHGGKTKTINDALIYFSTIYYLKKNKISQFVFLTKDSGDFGSPDNKNEVLHPELADTQIQTLYFTSLYKCFDKLKDELKIKQPDKEGRHQLIISKRGNKNFLDHFYDVMTKYRSKINFLPTHILAQIEPFRILEQKYDYAYHSGTTLLTNNKFLLEFFRQVDINKMRFKKLSEFRNTEKNLEKLNYIVSSLNQNLVYTISHVSQGEPINISKEINKECQCALCTYRRLSFENLLKEVYNEKDELKRAFVLFQLGKFSESLVVYNNIYLNSKKEDNNILAYRILLILNWVAQFAEFQVTNTEEKNLIREVNSIDKEKFFLSSFNESKLDREIALFLHGSTMIDHYKLMIKENVEKIREHYQSQLKASYSSNSNLKNLIHSFLNFEMFIVYNGMAFTRYSDFESICDDFTEGIFMSIALNEYQSSKIEYMDDFILERLFFYSKADNIIKYFNHYVKKQIPYRKQEKSFEKIVLNFLDSDKKTIDYFSNANYYQGNTSFYKLFWNLLALLAIVDFDKEFIINCTRKINNFLESLPKKETHQLHHLASLITSKANVLKKRILQPIFKFILARPNLHNEDVFSAFSFRKASGFKLEITSLEFENLSNLFFNKCEKCGTFHTNLLFQTFNILPQKYQIQTSATINKMLKSNFDKDLYYISVIGGIINYKEFFNQYLSLLRPIKKSPHSAYFMEGEITYQSLSKLMNIVFKTKAKLPRTYRDQFKGISDYYDWVIDMKGFDYKKFKPLWLIQYSTDYYLKAAFSVAKVKEAVRLFLRENNQPTLANYYSEYVN